MPTVENKSSGERFTVRLLGVLAVIPFIPPLLARSGATTIASVFYNVFGFLCHQRPDRSFFMFGELFSYGKERILNTIPYEQVFTSDIPQRFTCSEHYGCKFGVCARCTGMYLGLFGGAVATSRLKLPKIPAIIPMLMLFPLILDGIVQTIAFVIAPEHGFYESTNPRRFVTGLLFGLGLGYILMSAIKPAIAKNDTT